MSLFSCLSLMGQSSKDFYDLQNYRHTISALGRKITFFTDAAEKISKKTDLNKIYFWYGNNSISSTQGGYSGKLLDGQYSEFYDNKDLKEQGFFKSGLKDGSWKTWRENGVLLSMQNYREGLLDGRFYEYGTSGQVEREGEYKSGKLDGKIIRHVSADSISAERYKMGKLIIEGDKKNLVKRFFKRKKEKITKPAIK